MRAELEKSYEIDWYNFGAYKEPAMSMHPVRQEAIERTYSQPVLEQFNECIQPAPPHVVPEGAFRTLRGGKLMVCSTIVCRVRCRKTSFMAHGLSGTQNMPGPSCLNVSFSSILFHVACAINLDVVVLRSFVSWFTWSGADLPPHPDLFEYTDENFDATSSRLLSPERLSRIRSRQECTLAGGFQSF